MRKEAIVLFSGGLDSILVYRIIEKWGFQTFPIIFKSPFIKEIDRENIEKIYNIKINEIDFYTEQLMAVKHPNYGYGKALNPCIDCHAVMIKIAKEIMNKRGAQFIATGEVVGQRPMSQRKDAMRSVEKISDAKGYIVRPLSGKLLEKTIPEIKGIIKREWLYDISGRGRKEQYKIAEELGIDVIPSSGGGCLLTDIGFSKRLKKALEYKIDENYMEIIKYGRVFNLGNGLLIIGRDEGECKMIEQMKKAGKIISVKGEKGPIGIVISSDNLNLSCSILGRYTKGSDKEVCCTIENKILKERRYNEKETYGYIIN
jgi:tRNA U34 2-thiouridine synthase MnmA/TrmU